MIKLSKASRSRLPLNKRRKDLLMASKEVGLHDTLLSIRKRYRIPYANVLDAWKKYVLVSSGFHTPSTEEFHILYMQYMKNNIQLLFSDYVALELTEKGQVTIDEVLL